MARISVRRSRNSRATSWISRTDCVTRTTPSWPTTSARRWARSPRPSRLPRACGLTTTPIPVTSGGRARRGELAAGRLDVLPAALADGGADAVRAQDRLEAEDAGAGARGEPGAGERVEGDQVHLDAKPVQQVDEAAGVRVGIVLAGEEHVLEGDALAARQRQLAAGAQERRERKAAVDRHQTVPLRVGRRAEAAAHAAAGLARDAEREAVAGAAGAADLRDEHALDGRRGKPALARQVEEELPSPVGRLGDQRRLEAMEAELRREPRAEPARETRHLVEGRGPLAVQPGEDLGRPVAGLADARTPGLELRAVEILDVRPRHVGQLSAAVPRALPRACGRYGPRAVTSWPAACPGGRYGIR